MIVYSYVNCLGDLMATAVELNVQLVEVNAAIKAVLTAQSYKFNDGQAEQWVTKADLPNLILLRKDIESQIADIADDGGGFFGF